MSTESQYIKAVHQIAPQGMIWPDIADDSDIGKLFALIGETLFVADNNAANMLDESYPDFVGMFSDDWARVLGFPRCSISGLTAQQQRDANLAWLNISPYSNKQFFIDIAASLGYTITVEDLNDGTTYDSSTYGAEALTNGDFESGTSPWVLSNATIVNGILSLNNGSASQTGVIASGTVRVQVQVNNISGEIAFYGGTILSSTISTTGLHEIEIASNGADFIVTTIGASDSADIDFVSVRQKTASTGTFNPFEFVIRSTFDSPVTIFKVGQSKVGQKLVSGESNDPLECLINFFAPAHTKPIFVYS